MQNLPLGSATSTMPKDSTALIAGRTIQGTRVYSPKGDELGHIDDLMIDPATGRTVYGVLHFGGFLGIGAEAHAIPFAKLRYDSAQDGYVTDLTREQLEKAPKQDENWLSNRDWQQRSHDHYGVQPYWM